MFLFSYFVADLPRLSVHQYFQRTSFSFRDFISDLFFPMDFCSSSMLSFSNFLHSRLRLFILDLFSRENIQGCIFPCKHYCWHLVNWHMGPYLYLFQFTLSFTCNFIFSLCNIRSMFISLSLFRCYQNVLILFSSLNSLLLRSYEFNISWFILSRI